MTLVYLDTSAAMKLVIAEPESATLGDWLGDTAGIELYASWLLHAELHCAAGRRPDSVDEATIDGVLGAVGLVELLRSDVLTAGKLGRLRTNDAIHLATALRIGADRMLTYDRGLADASASAGLAVLSPGV